MSNKKKIVIVISIISIMILCFSISSFAYNIGNVLPSGTSITFIDEVYSSASGFTLNLSFMSKDNSYTSIGWSRSAKILRYNNTNVYIGTETGWNDDLYKTIILTNDYTIPDNTVNSFFTQNTAAIIIPDPPPHLEPSFWETVSGFFSEALASGTAIVNWMTITPIALIPLALYCLIVIIAITKRIIKG